MQLAATPDDAPTLASTVGSIAAAIGKVLPPGDVASLRRLSPDNPGCAPFWRLMAMHPDLMPETGRRRDELERRWACILQAMATMAGLHTPAVPLGRACAEADIAEQRILRLLRAAGPGLVDAVRTTAHHLAQKSIGSNHLDLVRLVLSDGATNEDAVRRGIARPYYAQMAKEAR